VRILFLFGAGASHGSMDCIFHHESKIEKKPPLGNQLYDELCSYLPFVEENTREINSIFREKSGFEREMVALSEYNNAFVPVMNKAIARYFFAYYPGPRNLYKKLANLLLYFPHEYGFTTLNYDLLLERSSKRAGFSYFHKPTDAKAKDSISYHINKPHGSCNFLPIFHNAIYGTILCHGYKAA
jgi:hypothetical protein